MGRTVKFYLGTHIPNWLTNTPVPLFVSHRTLRKYRTLPVANTDWALDSGGFTELSMHGQWTTSSTDYITAVRRYHNEIGNLQWAAPQDAMCEPWILDKARSWLGGTIHAHQQWTVNNLLQLRHQAPDLPFIPVLQGWQHDDYLHHIDQYTAAGINLVDEPVVGLGSVCRRQATADITRLVHRLADLGLNLHGFGVKTSGVAAYGGRLTSADSMAWSFGGRRIQGGCPEKPSRKACANCKHYALAWRDKVVAKAANPVPFEMEMIL
jgi:hypothetical protein